MVFVKEWWWLLRWWSWICFHRCTREYIFDNDANGSDENDDGYDVGIDDEDEDEDADEDDGSH